jgi:hypothetical protein
LFTGAREYQIASGVATIGCLRAKHSGFLLLLAGDESIGSRFTTFNL